MLLIVCLSMLCATGGCKQGPWQLWTSYEAQFIDPQGRVVDPQGGNRTTSEGESYALFFALVNNDRPDSGLDARQSGAGRPGNPSSLLAVGQEPGRKLEDY
jgi:hypothetical protein